MKVNINTLKGYFLVYVMLIYNQSWIYQQYLSRYDIPVIIVLLLLIFLKNKHILHNYSVGYVIFLLTVVTFVRFNVGGTGISVWAVRAIKILITEYAILVNQEKMIKRYVNVVYFLCIFSLMGFCLELIRPSFFHSLPIIHFQPDIYASKKYSSAINYIINRITVSGIFFYSSTTKAVVRNSSIFIEPGIFQMIILTAMFFMTMKNHIHMFSVKQFRVRVIVLIMALISCQSTTGIFGLIVWGGCVLISNFKDNTKNKNRIIFFGVILIIVLFIDLEIRNTESILYGSVIKKLFDSRGKFSLVAENSTGQYRVGTIIISLLMMLKNPFGVGVEEFYNVLNSDSSGYVGAAFLQDGAMFGIIPFVIMQWWILNPIIRSAVSKQEKLCIITLYFNTALAQASAYYPALILPGLFFLKYYNKLKGRKYESDCSTVQKI